jgi:hypothetical protein
LGHAAEISIFIILYSVTLFVLTSRPKSKVLNIQIEYRQHRVLQSYACSKSGLIYTSSYVIAQFLCCEDLG